MLLTSLIQRLDEQRLVQQRQGIAAQEIDHLAFDSRKVGPNGLFVALRGGQADGHLFIDKAVQNGAIAIVCEAVPADADEVFPGIAFAQVADTRAALAELAAAFYGDPSAGLQLVGVTGTNGKTTTSHLVHHALQHLGTKTGLLGTIAYRYGTDVVESSMTTPDAPDLHRMMREMREGGCTACSMEVSSHALAQERVRALRFNVGIFTNLTRDHLDYHETFQDYLAAKKRLFDGLPEDGTALYNLDDPAGLQMIADTAAQPVSYGQNAAADIHIDLLANRIDGLRLRIDEHARTFRLVGQFNAYNLAAAYGAVRALGFDGESVIDALAEAPPVPGRFEQIAFADGTTAIVDYAHTPDALQNVLETIRDLRDPAQQIWCIFGCGGDRDTAKRRIMGAIAERFADRVIATSDNPRTEDPMSVLADIRRGMDHPNEVAWIADRRKAIAFAAEQAAPGDLVLVAGKGHETYQVIGTEKLPFDDREEVRRFFANRGEVKA